MTSTIGPTGAVIHEFVGFTGETTMGGLFNIRGENFGLPSPVTVGGRELKVTSWRDHLIKGTLPHDFPQGPATVAVAGATFETTLAP